MTGGRQGVILCQATKFCGKRGNYDEKESIIDRRYDGHNVDNFCVWQQKYNGDNDGGGDYHSYGNDDGGEHHRGIHGYG